jgi:hypothetical protein
MRTDDRILGGWASGAVAFVCLGCSGTAAPPPFVDTTSGRSTTEVAYPVAPYGLGVGSTISDFDFIGYADPGMTTARTQAISLADFYNPHGLDTAYQPAPGALDDRLFPPSSGYAGAGKAKPTVLLIDVASVWCGPCNDESGKVFPQKYARYAPCGGEILLDLHDGEIPRTAATLQDLRDWTAQYGVDYPAVVDPAYKLDPLFQADAFPNNIIVDTTTMKIVDVLAGEAVVGTCSDVYVCTADADCALCLGSGKCASGKACAADADCQSEACTPLKFWTEYEAHLDRARAGCQLQ